TTMPITTRTTTPPMITSFNVLLTAGNRIRRVQAPRRSALSHVRQHVGQVRIICFVCSRAWLRRPTKPNDRAKASDEDQISPDEHEPLHDLTPPLAALGG